MSTTSQPFAQSAPSRSPWQRPMTLAAGIAVLLLFAAAGYVAWRMAHVPADLDYAASRLSDTGLFQGAYLADINPIPIHQMQSWTFSLATPDGTPIEGARISVDGGMPQHGHGLPTALQVTQELGKGAYRVEGLKFHMPGWWVVNFHITDGSMSDTITFNLMLE